MIQSVYGNQVEFGDEIGPLIKAPTTEDVQAFLSAWMTRDASDTSVAGRFTDAQAASREGLAGPIIPGNMTQAFLGQLLMDWASPLGRLRSLDVNFRRPAMHGQELKCMGLVTDTREEGDFTVVKLDVYAEAANGDRPVQGTAEVVLPTAPPVG
ncbi:MAG TPA: hypothetical protein VNL92_06800 [Dehalococcoidia bacterium]|nr:hypothetical protein [Dehalococcoidia bacterium]